MTKFITILISCSLTLAASVKAEQQDPNKKPVQKSKPVPKQQFTPKQHTVTNTHVPVVHNTVQTQHKNATLHNNVKIHDSNVSKQRHPTLPAVQSNKLPAVQSNKLPAVQSNKLPAVQSNKLPAVQSNKLPAVQSNKQTVQSIHAEHLNFHAQPNSAIASVKFNQNYHINGSENWKGNNYQVFQSYHPEWHDQGWWHSHHDNIVLIGGGWYYWNAGYWYPAWGYDTAAAYYPYDGPVYVGNNAAPLDQVVADVQSTLQQQGYYHGEVDGLLGPLTREALAAYQSAQGLYATATIDQPTLESLGLG
jgi:Putative peptidoglycan binding domain